MHCKKKDKPKMLTKFHNGIHVMKHDLDNLLDLPDTEENIKNFPSAYTDDLCMLICSNCRDIGIKANIAIRNIHNCEYSQL